MLPLLPALILLFLQGPSNFERLAVGGRLPSALEAINSHFAPSNLERLSQTDEQALASLIAAGNSAHITRALMRFLWIEDEASQPQRLADLMLQALVVPAWDSRPPHDGFAQCRRTRDGPATFGAAS